MIYINNEEKLKRINLKKDNFYVVADFDIVLSNRGTFEEVNNILKIY